MMEPCSTANLNFCMNPIGMESGEIPDQSINATSSHVPRTGPIYARLNKNRGSGAWCPKGLIELGVREYIQLSLGKPYLVTGVATQGRYDDGRGEEYTEEYTLEYWRPGMPNWQQYSRWDDKEVFDGNSDTTSVVRHSLTPPVHATNVRIVPRSVLRRAVCIRLELYGCPDESGLLSYTAPEPNSEKGDHVDKKYDGWKDSSGNMVGGLGVLTDGQVGGDHYYLDIGFSKGSGWMAWKNSSFDGNFMELGFEFDSIKNVSQIDLFTNNHYNRDVQIFSTAVVFFSIGGRYFNGEPVIRMEKEDKSSQKARNVTIDVQGGRLAKFIRIRLYFASEWLMLSEVYFRAETVNVTVAEETEQKSFEHLLENSIFISDADRRLTASRSTNIIVISIALISILLLILVPVVFLRKNHKYSSQNTASILKNTLNINIKDLFSNLTPPGPEADSDQSRSEYPRAGGRISQGRRAAAAESQQHQQFQQQQQQQPEQSIPPPFYPNSLSLSISSTHSHSSYRDRTPEIASGFGHPFLEPPPATPDRFGLDYDPYSAAARTTMVTAVSPDSSLRSRTIVSLAPPPKCSYNPNNLPNILQDGIHMDKLGESDGYYRVVPSNSRDNRNSDVPVQRFMTLGSALKKNSNNDVEDDDSRVNFFNSNTQGREKIAKNFHTDEYYDNNDKTFSSTDLKKIHGRCSTISKDIGAITIWNISPAFKRSFPEVDSDINAISINSLRLILKIGTMGNQEISIYETKDSKCISLEMSKIVQVKTVKMIKKDTTFKEYLEELKFLGSIDHPSLTKLVGLVTNQSPPLAVFEYTHVGDLYQHLRKFNNPDYIRFPVFLSIILQICSAMKYLEARETVHKDLAARNVLMFPGNKIKVTDTAMYSPLYADHYYIQEGAKPLPIRWLSWECTLLKRYTCPGSVWSFAITVWEIFDMCRHFPYENLSVKDIVKLAEDHLLKQEIKEIHPRPPLCPEDIYKVMLNCWERKSKNRPTFKEIYNFLKSKYIDLVPIDDHF